MEAVHTSETSVSIYLTTRQCIPEVSKLHTRRRENLKFHYGLLVTHSGMTSLLNLMKFYHLVQKLLGDTYGQTADLITLFFIFKGTHKSPFILMESRLKYVLE
jgi:hypothetical protein